ncbi:hypothetical protein [Halovivax gelatinilyticus]|uniref:hypothetical protein n=1 Tax=Halovivax gelatinilyticus TaxID=2961597 RepID=UPI0020CA575E|nr:hypothetical protein [Halovivax gelatinilyticus]
MLSAHERLLAALSTNAATEAPFDEETIALILVASVIVGLIIAIGAGYWVYRDAQSRPNSELGWAVGVGVTVFVFLPLGILALVAYLLVRSDRGHGQQSNELTSEPEW